MEIIVHFSYLSLGYEIMDFSSSPGFLSLYRKEEIFVLLLYI